MLVVACSTFFAAFMPYLVTSLVPDQPSAWRASGLLLGIGLAILFVLIFLATWPIRRQLSKFWLWLYLIGTSVGAMVVTASSLEVIGISANAAFLGSLLWMLFLSTTLFVRLILNPPGWEPGTDPAE